MSHISRPSSKLVQKKGLRSSDLLFIPLNHMPKLIADSQIVKTGWATLRKALQKTSRQVTCPVSRALSKVQWGPKPNSSLTGTPETSQPGQREGTRLSPSGGPCQPSAWLHPSLAAALPDWQFRQPVEDQTVQATLPVDCSQELPKPSVLLNY